MGQGRREVTPLHRVLSASPAAVPHHQRQGFLLGRFAATLAVTLTGCRLLCPSSLAGKSRRCVGVSSPSPLWQQTAWFWSQGLGKAQPADSASKALAPASLAGGCSLTGGYQDWGLGALHSLLPQDPAEGSDPLVGTCPDPHPSVGKGLGLPEGAFCRCCVGETVGAGGGGVCATQCRSPPSPIPWAGGEMGRMLRWPPMEKPSPPGRIAASRGHFWQVTHLTYLGAGAEGSAAPRGARPLPGQRRESRCSAGMEMFSTGAVGEGVCIWPAKSCPSFAAQLQP